MQFGRFARYVLPVLVWMGLIFYGSTGVLAASKTSGFLGPLLEKILPWASAETIHSIQVVIRKCGHLSEYAILAGLIWRALRNLRPGVNRAQWSARDAGWAIGLCALYAASDEWHQSFNPLRGASVWDVCIDTLGASLGLLVIAWIGQKLGWWREDPVGKDASASDAECRQPAP